VRILPQDPHVVCQARRAKPVRFQTGSPGEHTSISIECLCTARALSLFTSVIWRSKAASIGRQARQLPYQHVMLTWLFSPKKTIACWGYIAVDLLARVWRYKEIAVRALLPIFWLSLVLHPSLLYFCFGGSRRKSKSWGCCRRSNEDFSSSYADSLMSVLHDFLVSKTRQRTADACPPSRSLLALSGSKILPSAANSAALPTSQSQLRTFSKLNPPLTVVNANLQCVGEDRQIDGWRCEPRWAAPSRPIDLPARTTLRSVLVQWHE
jgi:hypothetical protein